MPKYPTPEQIKTLLDDPKDTPVVMLNLLKFNREATGANAGLSGVEAYMKYGDAMRKIVEGHGGRFLFAGSADSVVIGDDSQELDMVALVEYPSREAFVKIVSSPEVAAIGSDRADGLDFQWLIACTQRELGSA